MQHRSKVEVYDAFLDFIKKEMKEKRISVNRRMFSVLIWCFLIPAVVAGTLIAMIKFGVVPKGYRPFVELIILSFPLIYAIYTLGARGFREVIGGVTKGGVAAALEHGSNEARWREKTCENLKKKVSSKGDDWKFVVENFDVDLQDIQFRNRSMTVIAGAVFFFILQGIDFIDRESFVALDWTPALFFEMIEGGLDRISQITALLIFLLMLFVTGNEAHHSLNKYKVCARLLSEGRK